MQVRYLVICLRSSRSMGRSSVSCCRAAVDVVLKHPVMVFMARRCIDVRLFTCAAVGKFQSSGLCQIAAPYCILGLMTAVFSHLMYSKGVPHMTLAMLDSARANLVPFFVAYCR